LAAHGDEQKSAQDFLDLPPLQPEYTVDPNPSLTARSNEAAALGELERAALLGFAPPLIALVLGAATAWAVRGLANPK